MDCGACGGSAATGKATVGADGVGSVERGNATLLDASDGVVCEVCGGRATALVSSWSPTGGGETGSSSSNSVINDARGSSAGETGEPISNPDSLSKAAASAAAWLLPWESVADATVRGAKAESS